MIPYSRQFIDEVDIKSILRVLKSNFLTQGFLIKKFENEISRKFSVNYVTAMNSATSALHVACLALGIKKRDIVWTCTNSFVASSNCALYCGASIDLIDINSENFNLSIEDLKSKLYFAKKNKKLPKLVIPVHFAGLPCDMKEIYQLSKIYGFKILEDASHAIGAKYYNHSIGNCKYSDITVFSFHPVKIITTAEGGAALTNDKKLHERLELFKNHGVTRNKKFLTKKKNPKWYYEHIDLGYNYRLNEIQSALGLSQLKKLDKWIKLREKIFEIYSKELKNLPLILPKKYKNYKSANHLYVIQTLDNSGATRNKLYDFLRRKKIEANVHYIPIHTHPFYQKFGFNFKNFPNANLYYKRCLSIPMYIGLNSYKLEKVIKHIKFFFK